MSYITAFTSIWHFARGRAMLAGLVLLTNQVIIVSQCEEPAGGSVHARGRVLLGVGAQRRGRPALPAR